ncbi:ABC transporter ATP-binding protein [Mangrovactinospora gilvigrisea]|uniref:ABC transporter ATP-binding protein n=1 Tax=Mangrovactinospora gilvigrisea TaxID=1428644 RepID=A0A1J7BR50_9ACTN|nr:ABC transporter ATP-binding protein [Mangrovactinospora gilvigrisea]OIV35921.1 ABC transporter ATP-binding protein [Mangrovactinospora gilvigrisea]
MSLELESVTLGYPDGERRRIILDGMDLAVAGGELVAVTGPSGSGKSTLLAVAGTLTPPESGRVVVGGVDAGSLRGGAAARLRRERVGFVFQQANLLGSLTARDQLLLAAHIGGRRVRAADRARAEELLGRVGLAGKEGRRPHQLSGGERQRVGVARALMSRPAVLLVDEPTSALDRERGADVMALLAEVVREQGVAGVVVTHDLENASVADRVVALRDGRLTSPVRSAR